jgi:glycosyltransferase involved in cell wall biosynthesis
MAELPRMTIITPSYNQGAFIGETIESILNQGYPDLEYMVMDGGSTDSTLDVLQSYDGRLQWVSEPDRGQSHAINKGLGRATGEVIAFLNSDDVYEPGALLKVGQFFAAHREAHWVTGKCRTVDAQGREIRKGITAYKNLWLRRPSYRMLQVLNYISQPATFWRRYVVDTVGPFDEGWQYAMDYDYWLRAGRHFRLWFLNAYLARFRVHPNSKAGASANAQFDVDLDIARQYVSSPILLRLHGLHNAMIVAVYDKLLGVKMTRPDILGTQEI